MKRFAALACLAIALLCYACNSVTDDGADNATQHAPINVTDQTNEDFQEPPNSDKEKEQKQKVTDLKQTSTGSNYQDWDRKIIRTANIETEVKDLKVYTSQLRTAIKELGGYVSQEEFKSGEYRLSGNLTLKVPVASFEQAVAMVSDKTIAVQQLNIQSQDVSMEMVDVKARLEVRRTMRDRYMLLMQGAKSMEDLLKVQSEVNGIQEEIESGMSRVNYLSHASALSTIHLSCFQILQAVPEKPVENSNSVKDAFLTGWYFVGNFLIGLLTIWPVLLLITVIYFVYRSRVSGKQSIQ